MFFMSGSLNVVIFVAKLYALTEICGFSVAKILSKYLRALILLFFPLCAYLWAFFLLCDIIICKYTLRNLV